MLAKEHRKVGFWIRFVERLACLALKEPARIVPTRDLERLKRLAYREELRLAEERGDTAFIEREIERNQLTAEDRARIAKRHTHVADWPDSDPDLLAPDLFSGPARANE